jgi:isoleucyl-tRNA synthetase
VSEKIDYSNTLSLPETSFPMKAGLPVREPEQIKKWLANGLYQKIQKQNAAKPIFAMPDGPPYANGNIHVGHALNKILKDFVVKYKSLSGHLSGFIPGWDCHGLPIEHAVAKELGHKRREKSDEEIRTLCRAYAGKYISLQREQFKRLGIFADWDHPYTTMDQSYEASIIRALGKIFEKGYAYRGEKPVHWCWSDGTALAEAEVEYANRKDPSIYIKFEATGGLEKLALSSGDSSCKTYFIIWTTTPWTLPANLAISLNSEFDYGIYSVDGENWIMACALAESVSKISGKTFKLLKTLKGSELGGVKKVTDSQYDGIICKHPFIDRDSFVILGDHVTLDAGTGCVHTAPGHGQEDYIVGLKYGLEVYNPVDDWGKYTDKVPDYQGKRVFDANPLIVQRLRDSGHLVKEIELDHSFPHCWRCHNPVIFRATAQWFIAMDKKGSGGEQTIRERTLSEIKKVKWVPTWGENRITAMVENRPDWCISRQRLWGVPIPVFYCEKCGAAEASGKMMSKVADHVDKNGLESWYSTATEEFLDDGHKCQCGHDKFRKGKDILDVWFESGVCHIAVQEKREGLTNPADVYLEGSDQHRGWFQSSLLTSVAIYGRSPFKTVITHGFVNDAQGRKMSKSLGNVVDPIKFLEKSGAEILRLWTAYEDYSNDLQAGQESFDRVSESYRRVRNTCRYILGNLKDFNPDTDLVAYKDLLEIDKWALTRLNLFIKTSTNGFENFEYHKIYHALQNYCTVDLSAIYLDILKDRLYTAKRHGIERRAAQTTIYYIIRNLVGVVAPILSFLSEEVYKNLPGTKEAESIFLAPFPKALSEWDNEDLDLAWQKIFEVRGVVTKKIEEARQTKILGASLEAKVLLTAPPETLKWLTQKAADLPMIFIVSQVELNAGTELQVEIKKADGVKCERCWNYSSETDAVKEFPQTCPKCVRALS